MLDGELGIPPNEQIVGSGARRPGTTHLREWPDVPPGSVPGRDASVTWSPDDGASARGRGGGAGADDEGVVMRVGRLHDAAEPTVSVPTGTSRAGTPAAGQARPLASPAPVCLLLVFTLHTWLGWSTWSSTDAHGLTSIYTSVVWSLPVLTSVLGLTGTLVAVRHVRSASSDDRAAILVRDRLVVVVPTVARPDSLPALARVVRSFVDHLPGRFTDIRIDLVLEEGCAGGAAVAALVATSPLVRVLTVPEDYRTPGGSRFKARANHYASVRRVDEGEARDDVWVLHMDDDTAVGADTALALARFITDNREPGPRSRHLGQGVLTYPRELATRRVLWFADAVRPACDLSVFAGTTGRGAPRAGLHGELLLVRASIEATIGWDFGPRSIVEDAQFALEFCGRYPGGSDWFPARSYGTPPATVADFLRQRERWTWGLLNLVTDRRLPLRRRALLLLAVAVWSCAPLLHPVTVVVVALVLDDLRTGPLAAPLVPLWALSTAFCVWLYWEGLKINAAASNDPRRRWWEPVALVLLLPLLTLWEAVGVGRGLCQFLRRRTPVFAVIAKPV